MSNDTTILDPRDRICQFCNKPFKTKKASDKNIFCSGSCRSYAIGIPRRVKRLTIICHACGKPFEVLPNDAARRKASCCSYKCAAIIRGRKQSAKTKYKALVCEWCGKRYSDRESQIKENSRHFCSYDCWLSSIAVLAELNRKTCCNCGAKIMGGGKLYCSTKCYSEYIVKTGQRKTSPRVQRECLICGKAFSVGRATASYGQGIFCSQKCFGKYKSSHAENSHTRAAGGKREDLNNQYFRSSWEANWARYLNWLISVGRIKSWEFEPETFEFATIKRGVRFYTPDFRVVNDDDSVEYHEIKGWMDKKSATRMKRMAKYYPDIKIILIDADGYRSVARDVRRFIPEWETKEDAERRRNKSSKQE